jgi:hypothetical protein
MDIIIEDVSEDSSLRGNFTVREEPFRPRVESVKTKKNKLVDKWDEMGEGEINSDKDDDHVALKNKVINEL